MGRQKCFRKENRSLALHFTILTISVQLLWVESQSTVIFIIRDTIIIIIIITSISFAIFVMVSLVGIGNIRAVVQVVLMTIFVNILIAVTFISYTVRICIKLWIKCNNKVLKISNVF